MTYQIFIMRKLFFIGVLATSIISYSQLFNEDLKFIDTSQVVWEETALLEKPDSIIHYWSIDYPGPKRSSKKKTDTSYKASGIVKYSMPYKQEEVDSIYPYSFTYITDSSLNIIGKVFKVDTTQYTDDYTVGTKIYTGRLIYDDYFLVYNNGEIICQLATCYGCLSSFVLFHELNIYDHNQSDEIDLLIGGYSRGFNIWGEKYRK